MNYTIDRMNISDVCEWLTEKGYEDVANIISDKFSKHTWTVDGMIRKDVLKEIFERVYGMDNIFRAMECDVTTYMQITPAYEVHVD